MFQEKITILDGSFGFQLNKHLPNSIEGDPLWSAKALIVDPEAVIKTHVDYIKAGAEIIETNTYQASILGFKNYLHLSEIQAFELIQKAVYLAEEAILRCEKEGYKRPLIAGSVGSYGAYLHDGSEYTGQYLNMVTDQQLIDYHAPRITALVYAGVDLLAIETMPCKREALIVLSIVKNFSSVKAWVSFTCKNETLTAAGDEFSSAAIEVYNYNKNQIIAVGVNCTAPKHVTSLLSGLNKDMAEAIPLIVYANSGEKYDKITGWDNKSENLEDYIFTWLNLGVKIIGGCCRVCSDDIEKIKKKVSEWETSQKN